MDMKILMQKQIQEALKHKWIEGTKKGYDPGSAAINDWIDTYAATYRQDYNDCFEALANATLEKSRSRLQEACPGYCEETWAKISRIILEEFTNIWFLEMTKTDHNDHVDEV